MDALPDEILLHVISFLPLKDKFVAKSVCKEWNVVAEESIGNEEKLIVSSRSPESVKDTDSCYLRMRMRTRKQADILW